MSIDDTNDKFLDYLSDETNVKDFFNQSITELVRRIKEADMLAVTYKDSGNKQMFESVLRAKHSMMSELSIAEMLKLNFLGNIRHQTQIKDVLSAIVSDNKDEIQKILERIKTIEQNSKDLRDDKEFIDHLKRRYEDKSRDVSIE